MLNKSGYVREAALSVLTELPRFCFPPDSTCAARTLRDRRPH